MPVPNLQCLKVGHFFFSITGLNCVYWGGDQNLGVQLTLFKGGGGQGGLDYALNITAYMKVTYV